MPRNSLPLQHCLPIKVFMATLVIALCVACSILVLIHIATDTSIPRAETTLQLLHVVLQHGACTPAATYPLDPYINYSFAPFGWGQLTQQGKLEVYNVGKWLRMRYSGFLASLNQPECVIGQAGETARALVSLQSLLAGLCAVPDSHTHLNSAVMVENFRSIKACPRYDDHYAAVLALPEVKAAIAQQHSLYAALANHTGLQFSDPAVVQDLYWNLLAAQKYGLPLAHWAQQYFPHALQPLVARSYVYEAYTLELQKFKVGQFVRKLLTDLLANRKHQLRPAARKLLIYAPDDATLVYILIALGLWQQEVPGYAAMLLIELHRHKLTKEYHVELRWRRNGTAPLQKLIVPNCEFRCPFDKFLALTHILAKDADVANSCIVNHDARTTEVLASNG